MPTQIEIYQNRLNIDVNEFIIDINDFYDYSDRLKSKQRLMLNDHQLKDAILNYQSVNKFKEEINKLSNENSQLKQKLKLMETELLRTRYLFPTRSNKKRSKR
jgi:predicted nuclease with TOPRIM domain